MNIKGRSLGFVGAMVSIFFSLLSWLIMINLKTYLTDFFNQIIEPIDGYEQIIEEFQQEMDMYRKLVCFLEYFSLILLLVGIVAIVLLVLIKSKEIYKATGIFLIIFGSAHLLNFRLLAAVLLIIAGVQIMSNERKKIINKSLGVR